MEHLRGQRWVNVSIGALYPQGRIPEEDGMSLGAVGSINGVRDDGDELSSLLRQTVFGTSHLQKEERIVPWRLLEIVALEDGVTRVQGGQAIISLP